MANPNPSPSTRFKKGNQINRGRVRTDKKPKARNLPKERVSMFDQVISKEEQERFLQQCWQDAQNGDEEMRRFFVDRLQPARKQVMPSVQLPEHDSADPVAVCRATLAALADGSVSPDQAAQILGAVESLVAVAQGVTLGDELAQLSKTIEDLSGR